MKDASYSDQQAIDWMTSKFAMKFDEIYRGRSFIHPDSISLLIPKDSDVIRTEYGKYYTVCAEEEYEQRYPDMYISLEKAKFQVEKRNAKIIQRRITTSHYNGYDIQSDVAFHWPEFCWSRHVPIVKDSKP